MGMIAEFSVSVQGSAPVSSGEASPRHGLAWGQQRDVDFEAAAERRRDMKAAEIASHFAECYE